MFESLYYLCLHRVDPNPAPDAVCGAEILGPSNPKEFLQTSFSVTVSQCLQALGEKLTKRINRVKNRQIHLTVSRGYDGIFEY